MCNDNHNNKKKIALIAWNQHIRHNDLVRLEAVISHVMFGFKNMNNLKENHIVLNQHCIFLNEPKWIYPFSKWTIHLESIFM